MSNTIRIRTTPNGGDKFLKVKLEQDFDFIEILSLKISQEDAYRKYCSDYGVIVGRVVINNGFGVENAKVSVFIPLDDIDKNDPIIKGLYPYEVISDKDSDGIRYNLLPKESDSDNDCYTPVGTFPSKREVLDNDTIHQVYCKYYKFTTTTNHAGDFMIFGVPLGSYMVHVDADISDIGVASQRPYDFISQGTPVKLFESPTKFKSNKNLNKLIQVKTRNSGVNVQPFWGDIDNCEIGITRLDFDLSTTIIPSAIFMGSIYGDQHKHSINKRCRPRKKLGLMCDQVTGPGSVNMIRRTLDDKIEEYSVDGGKVIDDDGTWAFQVPMNLDYMVTSEDGSLILSQDPNVGLPTRARVRFDIGMDETGGEGRLRTRARYLVPNNPQIQSETDYTFGSETLDSSLKDLYWNKIYTVSNFITRFQRNNNAIPVGSRSFTGMKSVDACAGDKSPFPFNRVDTEVNPIFFIICLIITLIGFIVLIYNSVLVKFINFLIDIINTIIGAIVGFISSIVNTINSIPGVNIGSGPSWTDIPYVACMTMKCPEDPATRYAPGCSSGDKGWTQADQDGNTPNYYPGDSHGSSGLCGIDKCMAFEMAKTLNLFNFDFYNDWVTGTLFGFLLKYKKKKNKREVFCEYECSGGGFTPIDGTDGNQNGVGDNSCHDELLLDTCFTSGNASNQQKNARDSGTITDGLIKKVGDEFYYAARTHDFNYKLFATDIICLGSVFECDWQGIPHIQKLLIPTSYKIPPDEEELNAAGQVEVSGMVNLGGSNQCGNFFNIDCLGLHVDAKMCLNIRHICEMGVDIDQAQEDPITGAITQSADCIIGPDDIDDAGGKWFRDVYTTLNSGSTSANSFSIPLAGLNTNFNVNTINGYYNFATNSNNGQDYVNFRGYSTDGSYDQPKHSYFVYFGLLPGKTALDKMNQRFFTKCKLVSKEDILIQASSTIANGATGTIIFSFVGGVGPFTYTVTSSTNSYSSTGTNTSGSIILNGLSAGMYVITAVDSLGTPVMTTITVPNQPALYATAIKIQDCSSSVSSDGQIKILSVGGGVGPYKFELRNSSGSVVSGYALQSLIAPQLLSGLPTDNIPSTFTGYTITVTDSNFPIGSKSITGITINGPTTLVLTSTSTNPTCYGSQNGSISLTPTGGLGPFTYSTTGPAGYTSTNPTMTSLFAGNYTSTIIGADTGSATVANNLSQPPQLILTTVSSELAKQCNPTQYMIPYYIGSSAGFSVGQSINVEYSLDGGPWVSTSVSYQPTGQLIIIPSSNLTINIRLRFSHTWLSGSLCYSNMLNIYKSAIQLPPCLLTITEGSITPQCTIQQANINLNISHTVRAPYIINWSVAGGTTGVITPVSTTGTLVNIPIPASACYPASATITFTVTDSKGCVSPAMIVSKIVPQNTLALTFSKSYNTTTFVYTHTASAGGGVGGYVYSPSTPHTTTSPTQYFTVNDASGCSTNGTST